MLYALSIFYFLGQKLTDRIYPSLFQQLLRVLAASFYAGQLKDCKIRPDRPRQEMQLGL